VLCYFSFSETHSVAFLTEIPMLRQSMSRFLKPSVSTAPIRAVSVSTRLASPEDPLASKDPGSKNAPAKQDTRGIGKTRAKADFDLAPFNMFDDWLFGDTLSSRKLERLMDRLTRAGFTDTQVTEWLPKADVSETDKDVTVHAEIPGMTSDKINIELNDGILSISGEKAQSKQDRNRDFYRVERSYGRFERAFKLPRNAVNDPSKIKAKYENGTLEVTVPKTEETKAQKIKIET